MPRFESKFLLTLAQYEVFRRTLATLGQGDPNAVKQNAYPVFSAYFDTPDLRYFYQKMDGEFEHIKLRLRRYANRLDEPGICFLEVKAKCDQEQIKERQPLLFRSELLDPNSWWLRAEDAFEEIFPWMPDSPLVHVCNIYYEREAYELVFDGEPVRLNFDRSLVYLRPEETFVSSRLAAERDMLAGNKVILEIKGAHPDLPDTLVSLLQRLDVEQVRISKYAEAIQNLDIVGGYQEVIA
jgi:hypothetical protein